MNSYLKFLIFSNSIFCFGEGLFLPVYAIFITQIGGGLELAGVLYGVKFITTTLVVLLLTRIKDRINLNENLLELNYLIRGTGIIFFPNISYMFIAQMMIGTSEALGSPAFNSLMSEHLDKQKHITDWGYSTLLTGLTVSLASVLSGYIVTLWGFPVLFGLMAFFGFSSFMLLRFRKRINNLV
jgi:hypothetical protein